MMKIKEEQGAEIVHYNDYTRCIARCRFAMVKCTGISWAMWTG